MSEESFPIRERWQTNFQLLNLGWFIASHKRAAGRWYYGSHLIDVFSEPRFIVDKTRFPRTRLRCFTPGTYSICSTACTFLWRHGSMVWCQTKINSCSVLESIWFEWKHYKKAKEPMYELPADGLLLLYVLLSPKNPPIRQQQVDVPQKHRIFHANESCTSKRGVYNAYRLYMYV